MLMCLTSFAVHDSASRFKMARRTRPVDSADRIKGALFQDPANRTAESAAAEWPATVQPEGGSSTSSCPTAGGQTTNLASERCVCVCVW